LTLVAMLLNGLGGLPVIAPRSNNTPVKMKSYALLVEIVQEDWDLESSREVRQDPRFVLEGAPYLLRETPEDDHGSDRTPPTSTRT